LSVVIRSLNCHGVVLPAFLVGGSRDGVRKRVGNVGGEFMRKRALISNTPRHLSNGKPGDQRNISLPVPATRINYLSKSSEKQRVRKGKGEDGPIKTERHIPLIRCHTKPCSSIAYL